MRKISELIEKQRAFFKTGTTLDLEFRLTQLKKLKKAVCRYSAELEEALKKDLNKQEFESYATEVGMVLEELQYAVGHLKKWMRPQKTAVSILNFPSSGRIYRDPYGVTLVMSPWNYPVLLTLEPLIGAIEGGNCAVVKPSAYSAHTSAVLKKMLKETFPEQYIAVVEGGRRENQDLLSEKFDLIFFTGSVSVGKQVMEAASRHLTPVVLEMGGKSPCIVDETSNVRLAAKRIVWGKFLNGGQTCVAPDYVLAAESIRESFLKYLCYYIKKAYGDGTEIPEDYSRIVNRKHFDRLLDLMKGEHSVIGGTFDEKTLQIFPTVLDQVNLDSRIMQEEIFGPILPVLAFQDFSKMVQEGKNLPKPLAAYLFTRSKKNREYFLKHYQSGGACINDTVMHLANVTLPFGGAGSSGMGNYHGKYSFEAFTHERSVLSKSLRIDLPFRYPPYKKWGYQLLKNILP
jgi:aldehyde dehydrogenase (NAD+)